jgi:hypothetical protein
VTIVNVNPLSDQEKDLGTIIYSSAKMKGEVTKTSSQASATFESPDTLNGVIRIYEQDLLSRYRNYDLRKDDIQKSDALKGQATKLTLEGKVGSITVTAWPTTDGTTDFTITRNLNFQ